MARDTTPARSVGRAIDARRPRERQQRIDHVAQARDLARRPAGAGARPAPRWRDPGRSARPPCPGRSASSSARARSPRTSCPSPRSARRRPAPPASPAAPRSDRARAAPAAPRRRAAPGRAGGSTVSMSRERPAQRDDLFGPGLGRLGARAPARRARCGSRRSPAPAAAARGSPPAGRPRSTPATNPNSRMPPSDQPCCSRFAVSVRHGRANTTAYGVAALHGREREQRLLPVRLGPSASRWRRARRRRSLRAQPEPSAARSRSGG